MVGLNEFPAYPGEKHQSEVLNIQAIRDADAISLTNTTAQRFETTRSGSTRAFSYVVDGIDVGETIRSICTSPQSVRGEICGRVLRDPATEERGAGRSLRPVRIPRVCWVWLWSMGV